jgi:hypothetical protein
MTTATTLRPGLLVSLKTHIRGGIDYQRKDIELDHLTDGGTREARWETLREIRNPEEYGKAKEARRLASYAVRRTCIRSAFGLLCPLDRELELYDAIDEARKIASAHNDAADDTLVEVYILVGQIAENEAEAVNAINSELRELLDEMATGIAGADIDRIRDAAGKAKKLGAMLTEDAAGKVTEAVAEARRTARIISKKLDGDASIVLDDLQTTAIQSARFAFLDLDDAEVEPAPVSAPSLDLDPEPDEPDWTPARTGAS